MKKIFFYFILIILIITLSLSNYDNLHKNIKLEKEVTYLKLEKEVLHNKISIKISDDNKNLLLDYYNPKYKFIAQKLEEFENIDFLISISNAYGFDWKFFAIQIFYESSFNSNALSPTGAKGLMQLTSWVYNSDADPYNDIQNIFIGVAYFDRLYNTRLSYIHDEQERTKFALSAYHDGIGKIEQYRNIVKNYGLNPNLYENIEQYLSRDCKLYVYNIITVYGEIEAI